MEIIHIDVFLEYYEKIRERTIKVIKCIPEDKMDWTYKEGKFSLRDLIIHLANIERYMYAETVQGRKSAYPGHEKELMNPSETEIEYMNRIHKESINIFSQLSPVDLNNKCLTPSGTPITTWKWLRAMVEHEIHHRGQIYLYLGMLDIPTPPIFGLTAEEVLEKSR